MPNVQLGIASIALVGVFLGIFLQSNSKLEYPFNIFSSVLGWTYFICWSVSFYPQLYLNYHRKSVIGFSFDFGVYNLIGFTCYSIYNAAFYYNHYIQEEYQKRHEGHTNAVASNDVFFAIHAAVITSITLYQCTIYERGHQVVSVPCKCITCGILIFTTLLSVLCYTTSILQMLDVLYLLGSIKLGISLIKYLPQVHLNYKRKSTVGWTIWNVLLDFSGGTLSILQLLLDGFATQDWSKVSGDPVKFGLGFASMLFDIIFIVQHYILYPNGAAYSQLPSANK